MFYSAAEAHAHMQSRPTGELACSLRGVLRGKIESSWDGLRYVATAEGPVPSLKDTAKALRTVKKIIKSRDLDETYQLPYGTKFIRPWTVVPELANFRPTGNDYGVGVEVELGFVSREAAQRAADFVSRWRHTALDWEGPGNYPIEATFPPELYSKINRKSKPIRYCQYLADNMNDLIHHHCNQGVGTHVNVSVSPERWLSIQQQNGRDRWGDPTNRLQYISSYIRNMSTPAVLRYFGRTPYGTGRMSSGFIEWKLFNSVPCPVTMLRYIDIAVSLTELAASDRTIDMQSVLAACEAGYTKRQSVEQQAAEDDALIAALAA